MYSCLPILTYEGYKYCTLELDKRCFIHCLCYLELGVLQQLKLLPSPSSKSICCTPCLCFVFVDLSQRNIISLPSGAWSTTTIEVTVRAGNGTYCRPQIVCDSSSSHDKIKNNAFCFALCLTLVYENCPVLVANSFVDTPWIHFYSFTAGCIALCLSLAGCHKGI